MADDKEDLTRLEDLGEFLHQDDEETTAYCHQKLMTPQNLRTRRLICFR